MCIGYSIVMSCVSRVSQYPGPLGQITPSPFEDLEPSKEVSGGGGRSKGWKQPWRVAGTCCEWLGDNRVMLVMLLLSSHPSYFLSLLTFNCMELFMF